MVETEVIVRNIVVAEFVSLDNVLQAPGGAEEDTEGGFAQGGWTWPFWHDDIGAHFFEAMSRATRCSWAQDLADPRRGLRAHGRRRPVRRPHERGAEVRRVLHANLGLGVAQLDPDPRRRDRGDARPEGRPGKDIIVDGSSVLVHALAAHDLIDEYSLHVYPVVLGGGKKLFPEGRRVESAPDRVRPLPSGVVFMRYARA